jgi:hypothetical protein
MRGRCRRAYPCAEPIPALLSSSCRNSRQTSLSLGLSRDVNLLKQRGSNLEKGATELFGLWRESLCRYLHGITGGLAEAENWHRRSSCGFTRCFRKAKPSLTFVLGSRVAQVSFVNQFSANFRWLCSETGITIARCLRSRSRLSPNVGFH